MFDYDRDIMQPPEEREKQFDYKSLLKVTNIDVKNQSIDVEIGNIFDEDK